MIESFGDRATADLYHGRRTARAHRFPSNMVRSAGRRLDMLEATGDLRDLGAFAGLRLEALRGKLRGYYSVRVSRQWRLVFRWTGRGAAEVSLVDYH